MRASKLKWLVGAIVVLAAGLTVLVLLFPGTLLRGAVRLERGRGGLEEHTVRVLDHDIRYLRANRGVGPVILMVHGFGADKDNWTRFAPFFPDYEIVALDVPGFGESTRDPNQSYDIPSQARRLAAFAEALALPPHHVVGNSMGGHLVGAYVSLFPDNVRSVGFIANSGVTAPNESELRRRQKGGEHPLLASKPEDYERILDFVFVERPFLPGPFVDYLAHRAVRNRAFNVKVWKDIRRVPFPLEPELPKISVPVLILWGDSDRLLDVSSVDVMKPLIPHATVVIMKYCGHIPMAERPEETADHYRSFLASIKDAR